MSARESSVIQDVAYDPRRHDLRVKFHNARVYAYHGVPQRIWDALRKADSLGRFYNLHIRDCFPFSREA